MASDESHNASDSPEDATSSRLAEAAAAPSDQPVKITVRELLEWWGESRRTTEAIERIQSDLSKAGLTTDPLFTKVWIDHLVALVPQAPNAKAPGDDRRDVTLRIGHLDSANRIPETARMDEELMAAITRMGANRHTQLAVLGENGSVEGALSEGGIMRAFARGMAETVADATEPARLVRGEEHVLELLDVVEKNGFVIVVDRDAKPVGLVTAAELLAEFVTRHRPILTVASIELHIRQRVSTRIDPNEIAKYRPRWARRDPSVFPTLGQYPDLLAKPQNWDALDWRIDKTYFLNTLRKVARIRNDLAHFEADPLTEEQLQLIDSFLTVLLDLTQK